MLDAGLQKPDAVFQTPDAGVLTPDAAIQTPDAELQTPDAKHLAGTFYSDAGRQTPSLLERASPGILIRQGSEIRNSMKIKRTFSSHFENVFTVQASLAL